MEAVGCIVVLMALEFYIACSSHAKFSSDFYSRNKTFAQTLLVKRTQGEESVYTICSLPNTVKKTFHLKYYISFLLSAQFPKKVVAFSR